MKSRPLTERQQSILDFIVERISARGFPPTLREIGLAFEIKSTKGVNDHLEALEKKGRIRRHAELSRGIELVDGPGERVDVRSLPLVGRIAAGSPLLASENVEQSLGLDASLVHGEGAFMLRVQGDSMVNAHICDGDLIWVRPQDDAEDGEIVAVLVDEEATVKRFYREDGNIRLQPENDSMRPMVLDPSATPVRVLGRVMGVIRTI